MSVVLVNMPFAALERPSLALGLLTAILRRDSISCSTLHANLLFADTIGLFPYHQLSMRRPQDILGEWIFSPLIFPEKRGESIEYVQRLIESNQIFRKNDPEQLLASFDEVRDQCKSFVDQIAERVLEKHPRVVGCTSTFTQHLASIAFLQRIKELAPATVTLLGGGNCEAEMGIATHRCFPAVDFVVSGEADAIITPLIRQILNKEGDDQAEEMLSGVYYPVYRTCGYPARAGGPGNCIDAPALDGLPTPDFDEYFSCLRSLPDVEKHITPGLVLESSRGCWWGQKKGCTFCGLNGTRKLFRSKRPQTVFSELETLSNRYGVYNFETTDNILDMGFHGTLMPMLKDAGAPYSLFYETKSKLERHHVQRLREAGVIWIQPGIESLDSRVLALMNKGCKAWHNIRLLKLCRQFGIAVGWNLLCKFPGEEDEWYFDMARLFPLLHHLPATSSMPRVRFDRFSPYHNSPEQYGLDLVPCESYSNVYNLRDRHLMEIAYFFEDSRHRELSCNPLLKALLEGDGFNTCRKAHLDWYLRYVADEPPRLDYVDDGSEIALVDTRSCAKARERKLVDAERTAFLLMADGIAREKLEIGMLESGYSTIQIQQALESLLDTNTVILIDNVLLSLALERPLPDMPRAIDYPGGTAGYPEGKTTPDQAAKRSEKRPNVL